MRLIVAGTRTFNNYQFVKEKLMGVLKNTNEYIEIVSGCCDTGKMTFIRPDGTAICGADGLGEKFASEQGYNIVYFKADWNKHGKAAGPIRNKQMAEYGTHCVVFWDGVSSGTMSMINEAQVIKGIPTRVIRYQESDMLKKAIIN